METLKNSYISRSNFPSSKNKNTTLKKLLIFREIELSSPTHPLPPQKKLNKTF